MPIMIFTAKPSFGIRRAVLVEVHQLNCLNMTSEVFRIGQKEEEDSEYASWEDRIKSNA